MDWLWVIAGVLGLWLGTELAVRAGGEIGRRLGLSELFLGLTVFAIGTDIAEVFVAIGGAMRMLAGEDTSGLVVGNALGSVLAQGSLVLGVIAFFAGSRIAARKEPEAAEAEVTPPLANTPHRDALVWLGSAGILYLMAHDGRLTRAEGFVLASAYVAYFAVLWRANLSLRNLRAAGERAGLLVQLASLVVGLAVVAGSADQVLEHGLRLAARNGIDATALGLFALGAGTSLPELAVSIAAAVRGRPALSLGNVLGSNTFDLLVPLGVSATIHPIAVEPNALRFDLPAVALLASYASIRFLRGGPLSWLDAFVLFGFYMLYFVFRMGTVAA